MQSATPTLDWTRDEEIALLARAKSSDAAAIEALVTAQMPAIRKIAGRYAKIAARNTSSFTHEEDLIQEGVVGVMLALRRFAPVPNANWASYCRKTIKGAIIEYSSRQGHLLKVPEKVRLDNWKINGTANTLAEKLERTPSDAEIAAEARLSERVVKLHRNLPQRHYLTGEDEAAALVDDQTPDLLVERAEDAKFLTELFSVLTPDETEMVSMCFGLDDGNRVPMAEVGRRMGRKDVKPRIAYALIKMRRMARRLPCSRLQG
jgi:RNA polymerase sigma factor (sigma-70 family)